VATADYDPVTDRIIVHTAWNEKQLVTQVPGARYDATGRHWVASPTWSSLVILRGVFKDQLTLTQRLIDFAWELRREWVDEATKIRVELDYPVTEHTQKLYPFQRAGVAFMHVAHCGLLGDEMGAGKSIQALTVMADGGLPAIVICPNSVKRHWAREAARWLPEATPYVVEGTAVQRRKILKSALGDLTALVIMNIEAVRLFSRLAPYGSIRLKRCRECDPRHGDEGLKPNRCDVHHKELNDFDFQTFILDEAHRVKDPAAQQTRAIWHVAHNPKTRYRWALTGTPIANHPGDLWSVMHTVAPAEFPIKSKFVDRFCLISWNAFGGSDVVGIRPDTRDELFKLLDPRFRRMLKAIVLPQLPPKVRQTRYAELSSAQQKVYRELEQTLVSRTPDGELLIAKTNLSAQTRLIQLAAASVSIEKVNPDDVSTWKWTLREPSPKLDVLEEVLDELGLLTNGYDGPPVLIAAEHRQLIELAAERLKKLGVRHAQITGAVAEGDRERALDDLRARRIRALLFTNQAGGVGLDMSASDTLINIQRSWSLVAEKQKEDRPHRPGAEIHERIRIIDIVTRDTVEEKVIERLHEKLARLDELTRDRAMLLRANVHADTAALDAEEQRLLGSFVGVPTEE
jgi:SNF2 family DNA or RNA helicase